ncbi:MAG: AAA family ATPase [Candidatus Binatia bacterium]
MSRGLSELQSAFDGFPAGHFFYSNLPIQETLTTIRYGIEARKGLVLIIGEAGIGKTTLLHKIAKESAANVTCIVESDPRVNFTEVLRLILRSLGIESAGADEPSMVRSCQLELRARLEKCQIFAMIFDNAHHLSEQTLRHVIKNFLGGSAADPDGTLVQLVLAGRPELKVKLSQAALVPLRRRTPILCELQPLNSQEIGSYIEHRLRSNNHAGELFDTRAVKRIALYTKGNPGSVNALCERAAQLADESTGTVIGAELIDDVARDLGFRESAFVTENINIEKNFEKPDQIEPSARRFHLPEDYMEAVVGRTFLDYNKGDERQGAFRPAKRRTAWSSVMLFLIAIGGAGVWMGTETARDSLSYWSGILNGMIARIQQPQASVNGSETAPESMTKAGSLEPLPTPAILSPPSDPYPAGNATQAPPETSLEPPTSNNGTDNSLTRDAKSRPRVPSPSNDERRAALKASSNQRNQDLQSQIIKAIENRAITGVEVSVVGGTAYLDGRVATERQRRAAERAAHSVAGVERVRNRISINFG